MPDKDYYLIRGDMLPEVFVKVIRAKELLAKGVAQSVNEAVKKVGLSRSSYYKYRDAIRPNFDMKSINLMTVVLIVENTPGLLAEIIHCLTDAQCNVLTINQTMPINGLVDITLSIETNPDHVEVPELMIRLGQIHGVRSHQILKRVN
ncbi:MAG: ACT domain-containing protein [Fastidiosipilaceae bacterium]|jgi:chorismate mutase|nr:ACT domain-containing protein [Clostridiaceae bacterium]